MVRNKTGIINVQFVDGELLVGDEEVEQIVKPGWLANLLMKTDEDILELGSFLNHQLKEFRTTFSKGCVKIVNDEFGFQTRIFNFSYSLHLISFISNVTYMYIRNELCCIVWWRSGLQ